MVGLGMLPEGGSSAQLRRTSVPELKELPLGGVIGEQWHGLQNWPILSLSLCSTPRSPDRHLQSI